MLQSSVATASRLRASTAMATMRSSRQPVAHSASATATSSSVAEGLWARRPLVAMRRISGTRTEWAGWADGTVRRMPGLVRGVDTERQRGRDRRAPRRRCRDSRQPSSRYPLERCTTAPPKTVATTRPRKVDAAEGRVLALRRERRWVHHPAGAGSMTTTSAGARQPGCRCRRPGGRGPGRARGRWSALR